MGNKNKVKYGLKNVYYAKATIADDGSATYATPKAWRGAVSLSMDAQGDTKKFRADNINYWIGTSNTGYEGDFESALVPEDFLVDILGYTRDANGILVEDTGAPTIPFALLFQFEGDINAVRHALYYVTATRPSVSGQTTEESIEPKTETVTFSAGSVYNAALDKDIVKAKAQKDDAPYGTWFDAVYQPTNAQASYTVTQNLTNITSDFAGVSVAASGNISATLTAGTGYTIDTVMVTMGGDDITATAWSSHTGKVTIDSVIGNVVITASAVAD